jgi:predicted N-acetyltransferase YhbS
MNYLTIRIRPYVHDDDYDRVGDFLFATFQHGDFFINWLQPRWEYMHYHSYIKELDLSKIGIAEDDGEIVGVVHFEGQEGQIYFQVHPEQDSVKKSLLNYAEETFRGKSTKDGRACLALFINEHDTALEAMAKEHGFEKHPEFSEEHSRIVLDHPIPEVQLPEGFALQSLADENDFHKINQVLWRGFNHEGPPPEEYVQSRKDMQKAPNFRQDLNIVVVAPEGHFVSYSGIWYVEANRVGYVEPVATDPDYRRMGLGKAAVLECVRRVAALGAEVAWVGSGQEFYKAIGFTKTFDVHAWVKYYEG